MAAAAVQHQVMICARLPPDIATEIRWASEARPGAACCGRRLPIELRGVANEIVAIELCGKQLSSHSSVRIRHCILPRACGCKPCLHRVTLLLHVALCSRRADERRRKRAREQQEDEADRRAEAEEQRQRKEADAASPGPAPSAVCRSALSTHGGCWDAAEPPCSHSHNLQRWDMT